MYIKPDNDGMEPSKSQSILTCLIFLLKCTYFIRNNIIIIISVLFN